MLRDFGAVTVVDLTVVAARRAARAALGARARRALAPATRVPAAAAAPRVRAPRRGGRAAPSAPTASRSHDRGPRARAARLRRRRAAEARAAAPPRPPAAARDRAPPGAPPRRACVPLGRRRGGDRARLLLLVATLRHGTERGARGVPVGQVMPPFAVAARARHARRRREHRPARRRGPGRARAGVHGPRPGRRSTAARCASAGPVVLAFFTRRAARAASTQLDAMQRVQRQVPGVRFAAVAIRGDRDDLRALVRRHGWRLPGRLRPRRRALQRLPRRRSARS